MSFADRSGVTDHLATFNRLRIRVSFARVCGAAATAGVLIQLAQTLAQTLVTGCHTSHGCLGRRPGPRNLTFYLVVLDPLRLRFHHHLVLCCAALFGHLTPPPISHASKSNVLRCHISGALFWTVSALPYGHGHPGHPLLAASEPTSPHVTHRRKSEG